MGNKNLRVKFIFLFCVLYFILNQETWSAESINQNEAQRNAADLLRIAADKSLESSASNSMQALVLLSKKDISHAVSQAYKAYGDFKNSENLDRMQKLGILSSLKMQTVETFNISDEDLKILKSKTSFRRLNPNFLSSGESAKISAEFERQTGIKKQDFLELLSTVSEAQLFVSDPKLAEKAIAAFDSFVSKIPNKEFQAKIIKAKSFLPDDDRRKLLGYAVQQMVKLANRVTALVVAESNNPNQRHGVADQTLILKPSSIASTLDPEELSQNLVKTDTDDFAISSDLFANQKPPKSGEFSAANFQVNELLKSSTEKVEEPTLFERVSRKYKSISNNF